MEQGVEAWDSDEVPEITTGTVEFSKPGAERLGARFWTLCSLRGLGLKKFMESKEERKCQPQCAVLGEPVDFPVLRKNCRGTHYTAALPSSLTLRFGIIETKEIRKQRSFSSVHQKTENCHSLHPWPTGKRQVCCANHYLWACHLWRYSWTLPMHQV